VDISADETFKPVIEAEKLVFDSSFPNAKVNIHYKPEAECFKDYFDNKARVILVTRALTKDEKDRCDQLGIYPSSVPLARDAIAVIVNNESQDTIMDMPQLKGILTGVYKKKYTVVFDNQGSSTLSYVMDSVLKGQKLGANVYAAKGNKEVVDYVLKNPDAIGFVGLGYVSDTLDPDNTGNFIKNVRVMPFYNDTLKTFIRPYLAYIGLKQYPFTRKLFYVSREGYPGIGTGFANFLAGPRGQLIFYHSHLFPLRMEIILRDAEIKHNR
jgi:phosphate transport system substrate-binding protein